MAGLNLSKAVDDYQQGVQWRQQQEQVQREQALRADIDAANKEALAVVDESKAQWALAGAPGTYRPNDETMLRAMERRSEALAKRGRWNEFVQSEAAAAPARLKVRAGALQRYEQDGDFESFLKAFHRSLPDGLDLVSAEKVEGAPGSESLGLPERKGGFMAKFRRPDGQVIETFVDPVKVVGQVKLSLVDPAKTAEKELEMSIYRNKALVDIGKQTAVEEVKGDQTRKTENLKAEHAAKLEDRKANHQMQIEGVKLGGRERIQSMSDAAAMARTQVTAGATLGAAQTRANATRDAAGVRAGGKPKPPSSKDLQTMVENSFGKLTQGGFGSRRVGGDVTAAIAAGAEAYMNQYPDVGPQEAIQAAKTAFKKKYPNKLPDDQE